MRCLSGSRNSVLSRSRIGYTAIAMSSHTIMNRLTHLAASAMLLASVVSLTSCANEPTIPTADRPAAATAADGPFVPVRVRIHPLTRIVTGDDNQRRVDVHLELYDSWGHAVKGLGSVLFELYRDRGGTSELKGSRQLMRWPVIELLDSATNSRTYDPVTRTYLFRLRGLPADLPEGRLVLYATFTTAGGERLPTAEHVVD